MQHNNYLQSLSTS